LLEISFFVDFLRFTAFFWKFRFCLFFGIYSIFFGNFVFLWKFCILSGNFVVFRNFLFFYGNFVIFGNLFVVFGNFFVFYGILWFLENSCFFGKFCIFGNFLPFGNFVCFGTFRYFVFFFNFIFVHLVLPSMTQNSISHFNFCWFCPNLWYENDRYWNWLTLLTSLFVKAPPSGPASAASE